MSRKITNEIIDERLSVANRTIIRIGNYTKAREKIEWECTVCNNHFSASPDNISRGKGCPHCATNTLLTSADIDKKLIENHRPIARLSEYTGANTKIEWQCIKCEHIWCTTPSSLLSGYGCPSCAGQRPLTNEIVDSKLSEKADKIYRKGKIVNAKIKIKWKCDYGHEWDATPSTILHKGSGCPVCQIKGTYNKGLTKKEQQRFAKLYFVKFTQKSTNISFVKIGITQKTINKRFDGYNKKYNIEILHVRQISLMECINLEQEVIRKFHNYQYIPEGYFPGKTECFIDTPEVKESILEFLE